MQAVAAILLDQLDQLDRFKRGFGLNVMMVRSGALSIFLTPALARDAQLMRREQ